MSIQARRRPRVAVISASDISDIYLVRADLLARMVRLVVERASDEELRDVGSWLEQMRAHAKAKNVDAYFWAHVALQEQLAEIAQNRVLKQILDSLALRTLVLRHRSISLPACCRQAWSTRTGCSRPLTAVTPTWPPRSSPARPGRPSGRSRTASVPSPRSA